MGLAFSFFMVVIFIALVVLGVEVAGLQYLFGIIVPYIAFAIFLLGMAYRILKWARAPVPFRIPTTAGQQKSLPWIKASPLENPSSTAGVIGRMALEVLFFRSLLRNTRMEMHKGPRLAYHWEKWLWLGGLTFHWSLLVILLRHLRYFTEPVPAFVSWLEDVDGFFRIGLQGLYITDVLILVGITYLFLRRVIIPQVRYISLPADYFPLFLLMGIAGTGVLMRYFYRIDVTAVKELAMGLITFHPIIPANVGVLFYVHLFLVCVLGIYFPFSKLVHMGGIFLSPTRNLPNDSRARRHINPWNYPVKVHTYEEYEEEFRDKMKMAGLPVEKP
ncbi:sulfate reduction electron transfer complex DsrMKJOP subunit DsrM [Neomoorella humiferrea]|uniref:sulfate reduction electron transfer complex DsrMKJOP subunit DsrM n=1 Tax=Neomoorella humiferrea TaxID=676965 RepID=UPI003D923B82